MGQANPATPFHQQVAARLAAAIFDPFRLAVSGAVFVVLLLLYQAFFQTEAGYHYVYQNTLTGNLTVYSEPGVHFRLPFFSRVTQYKEVSTISFGEGREGNQRLTRALEPITVRFADTYTGAVPATFRFKIAPSPEGLIHLHREFRSFDNLVDALLIKNARNVTVITATQYTGEEFFQGGLNRFKSQLEDQLRNGVYITERKQVEVEQTDLAPVGLDQEDSGQLQRTRQLVWKTVPVMGADGQLQRQTNPLEQYAIQVTQVTVGDPVPERLLEELLVDKKRLVAERIRTIQEQETARAKAKTEQLNKEIERTRAVQDAQRQKELAVIAEVQKVEVARQIAERELIEQQKQKDVAVIQKQRELAVAQANRDIQEAAAEAAVFEAQAIRSKGEAEADVLKARYAALGANAQIYLAEVQRDIAQVLYTNLANFQVQMPLNYVGQGGEEGSGMLSNLDVITAFSALGLMDQLKEQLVSPRHLTEETPRPAPALAGEVGR